MIDDLFDFLIRMEGDMVEYYKRMKKMAGVSDSSSVFDFMIQQSAKHETQVIEMKAKMKFPTLNEEFIQNIHNQINESLLEEAKKAANPGQLLEKSAKAEELVGKLYELIVKYCTTVCNSYSEVSTVVDKIAHDEYDHRDALLGELKKY